MVDAGTAKRSTGTSYTGGAEVEATTDLFTSRCKIQSGGLQPRATEVGERTSLTVRPELHLPASTAQLTAGDLFVVTTPHALSTVPAGTTYRVTGPAGKTFATARRYEVEEVVT